MLRLNHFSWINTLWIISSLWLIPRILKILSLTISPVFSWDTGKCSAFMGEQILEVLPLPIWMCYPLVKSLNCGLTGASHLHFVRICLASELKIDWRGGTDSKKTVKRIFLGRSGSCQHQRSRSSMATEKSIGPGDLYNILFYFPWSTQSTQSWNRAHALSDKQIQRESVQTQCREENRLPAGLWGIIVRENSRDSQWRVK